MRCFLRLRYQPIRINTVVNIRCQTFGSNFEKIKLREVTFGIYLGAKRPPKSVFLNRFLGRGRQRAKSKTVKTGVREASDFFGIIKPGLTGIFEK